jgi:hypothetical protein
MYGSLLAAIAQPPFHDPMPKTAEWLFTAALLAMTCIALVIAVRQLVVRKDPLLLYCVIGGALGALFEPIVDVLGQCFLKQHGAIGTYTYLGRTIPLYLLFAYPWYNGGLAYLYFRLMQRGVATRTLFALWAATGVADVLEETPGILGHLPLLRQAAVRHLGLPAVVGVCKPAHATTCRLAHLPTASARWRGLEAAGDHPADTDGRCDGQRGHRHPDLDHAQPHPHLLRLDIPRWVRHTRAGAVLGLDHLVRGRHAGRGTRQRNAHAAAEGGGGRQAEGRVDSDPDAGRPAGVNERR